MAPSPLSSPSDQRAHSWWYASCCQAQGTRPDQQVFALEHFICVFSAFLGFFSGRTHEVVRLPFFVINTWIMLCHHFYNLFKHHLNIYFSCNNILPIFLILDSLSMCYFSSILIIIIHKQCLSDKEKNKWYH